MSWWEEGEAGGDGRTDRGTRDAGWIPRGRKSEAWVPLWPVCVSAGRPISLGAPPPGGWCQLPRPTSETGAVGPFRPHVLREWTVITKCCSCSFLVCSRVCSLLAVAGAATGQRTWRQFLRNRQVHHTCVAGTLGKFLGGVVLVWVFSHGNLGSNGLFRGSPLKKSRSVGSRASTQLPARWPGPRLSLGSPKPKCRAQHENY